MTAISHLMAPISPLSARAVARVVLLRMVAVQVGAQNARLLGAPARCPDDAILLNR